MILNYISIIFLIFCYYSEIRSTTIYDLDDLASLNETTTTSLTIQIKFFVFIFFLNF